jgi:hypothetical protein
VWTQGEGTATQNEGCGRRHAQAPGEQLEDDHRGQQQEHYLEARH